MNSNNFCKLDELEDELQVIPNNFNLQGQKKVWVNGNSSYQE